MSSIETTFTFGKEVTFESLTIVPLLGTSSSEPDYDTLDEALARGTLRIGEVSESGQVPDIRVLNEGQLPVLIIDGEELVGAKQNRTVNLSILIPAAADVIVPVTCVEAGRWSRRSRNFAASSRTHFAAGRASKSSQVSASLLRCGIARADQSQVWEEIEEKSVRLQARSSTRAMGDIFEQQSNAVEAFVRGLPVAEHQVGAVFGLDSEPMGVDLFDSPRTFRSLIPKIVRGYALDAIDRRSNPLLHGSSSTPRPPTMTRARAFMRRVLDAPRTQFARRDSGRPGGCSRRRCLEGASWPTGISSTCQRSGPETMADDTSRSLEAHAAAFAQILAATDDADAAFRQAAALADGLFPHQVEGVAFLLGRRRAILADDMGLGKTRQALAALSHAAPAGQVLIVCPASVKRNWAREISLAAVEGTVHIMEGTARQPISPDARWIVANYDILRRHVDAIGAVPWAGLIFDEAHYLKNHTSTRSKVARELASRAAAAAKQAPPVYLLTGTPLTNRPRDLFVLLQLVGHPLGRSFLSFAKRYCAAEKNEFGWKTDGASNLEELTVQLHGTMLRRAKEEVLSLPPKLRAWLPTTAAAGIAATEMREVVSLLAARATSAAESNDQRARTRLLASLTKVRHKVAVAKVPTTLELARSAVEQGEKVIVFSCFEAPLQQLAEEFGSEAVVLTGKVPSGQRQHLVDRFQQDDEVRVFLANIIAGGTGVTLTAATQVIFNDLDWVPANHWQAEDRAYRIGQTRTVNVTYVVGAGTIDEFVQVVLETKTALVQSVVEGDALAGDGGGEVLQELERAIAAMSPGLADTGLDVHDQEVINELVRAATEQWRHAHNVTAGGKAATADPATIPSLRAALEMLARVLAGPRAKRFRIASSSKPGSQYVVDADGADVICSCPGFEYRGQCRHARDVKRALASGTAPPTEYVAVE